MEEEKKKFDKYYKQISNGLNDRVFSAHKMAKSIVKSLFYEAEAKGLNTKEMLEILDTAKEMILKFKPSIPSIY